MKNEWPNLEKYTRTCKIIESYSNSNAKRREGTTVKYKNTQKKWKNKKYGKRKKTIKKVKGSRQPKNNGKFRKILKMRKSKYVLPLKKSKIEKIW